MAETLISAEDLLAKMRAGVKEVYEIRIGQLIIPVRLLSIDEEIEIRNKMIAQNTRAGGDEVSLAALIQKETLRTATFIAKNQSSMPDRFFAEMRRDELTYIFNEYFRLLEEANPSLETMPPEQFMVLVDALKKNHVSVKELSIQQLYKVGSAFQELIQRPDFQVSPEANSSGTLS